MDIINYQTKLAYLLAMMKEYNTDEFNKFVDENESLLNNFTAFHEPELSAR